MINTYRITPKNIKGRFVFFGIAIKMLFSPCGIYRLCTPSTYKPLDLPGASIGDVLDCISIAWWHADYGVTFVLDGKILKPSEWDRLRNIAQGST